MTPISTIKATGKTTLYAFPGGVALSTWSTNRRLLTETATGYYTTTVDETIGSGVWYLFEGASQPASYNNGLNEIFDFTELKILEDVPKYGEAQRWTSPANALNVTVSRAP